MKNKSLRGLSLILFAPLVLAWGARAAAAIETEETIAFEIPNLEGKAVSLEDEQFEGKVVLVDIWGTWCPPCRKAIPHLKDMHSQYKDSGLEIVGIAFEKSADESERLKEIRDYVEKEGIEYTVLHGGRTGGDVQKRIKGIKEFSGYPSVVIIGRDGKVRKTVTGYSDKGMKEIDKTVAELLNE